MSTLKKHLRLAIRHLKLEHTELDQALDHAISEQYAESWIHALEKAVKTNLETTTHVQNILATIRHDREPLYGIQAGQLPPRQR